MRNISRCERKRKASQPAETITSGLYQQQEEEKEITEDPGEKQDESFESLSKKPREEYAYLKVPYDILNSPRLVQMADRAKISDRATVGLVVASLKSFKTIDD